MTDPLPKEPRRPPISALRQFWRQRIGWACRPRLTGVVVMTVASAVQAQLAPPAVSAVASAPIGASAPFRSAPGVVSAASPPGARRSQPPAPAGRDEGIRWSNLSAAQRTVLAPLEREWPSITASRKLKWIAIAGRFHTLPPAEQTRISQRMTEWVRLTPAERGEVRLRFQESRDVPAPDRSARWEAYQKLAPGEKQKFLARAAAASARASASALRPSGGLRDASHAKANVVPNPALAPRPRSVAPTVLQASPGATTRLITRPAVPPAHQSTGMPKIAATPEFVNRSTLLPRRGPQAAAVVSASSPLAGAAASAVAMQPLPLSLSAPPTAPSASNPVR
ncbi:MAG: DUF3106 domain-containing protein [Pseudomonadota bacterium]|nr:DUF3106 domain-containing protein [Pseudomonadota bacterium]